MKMPLHLLKFSLVAATLAISQPALSTASVLVWPIDPMLEDYQKASAVWIENKGDDSAYFQIRVVKWTQVNGEDRYDNQKEIVVSPPFAMIQAKQKQMIRLVRDDSGKVPAGREFAYRVLIDEIPKPPSEQKEKKQSGLQYQMRYFIPLFSNGEGIWTKEDFDKKRAEGSMSLPLLSAKIIRDKNRFWLEVHNNGAVHARLSALELVSNTKATSVLPGLVGYVLPNSTMRFALPSNMSFSTNSQLRAMVNNQTKPVNLM